MSVFRYVGATLLSVTLFEHFRVLALAHKRKERYLCGGKKESHGKESLALASRNQLRPLGS
jgi:hypothetical protein